MTTRPHLTLADVKTAGLAALQANKLSAQGPTPVCAYRDKTGHPCIIGAAFPEDFVATLKPHQQAMTIGQLADDRLVTVDPLELSRLNWLQQVHDRRANITSGISKPDDACLANAGLSGLTAADLETLLTKELSK